MYVGLGFLLYLSQEVFSAYMRGYLRAMKRLSTYCWSMVISTAVAAALAPLLVPALGLGVAGALFAYGAGGAVGNAYLLLTSGWTRRVSPALVSLGRIRALVGYSIYLVPNDLSWWIMGFSDRQIINLFFGDAANGVFAVAHKLPAVCSVLLNAFSVSWQQEAVELVQHVDRQERVSQVFQGFMELLFSALSVAVSAGFILYYFIFPEGYFDAIIHTPILIAAAALAAVSQFLGGIQIALKRPGQNGAATAAAAVCNLLLHLSLARAIGLFAASISTLAANLIMLLIRLKLIRKELHLKLSRRSAAAVGGFCYFFAAAYLHRPLAVDFANLLLSCGWFLLLNRGMIAGFAGALRSRAAKGRG